MIYEVRARLVEPYLQHRYPTPEEETVWKQKCEDEGLDPKRTDNIEGSWYKTQDGKAYIPAEHIKGSIVAAGKGEKVKGKGKATWSNILKYSIAVFPREVMFVPPKTSYDYIDERYVLVSGARIWRKRPAFESGSEFSFTVEADSQVDEKTLTVLLEKAGRMGIGDMRPSKSGTYFGVYAVLSIDKVSEKAA